jgi:RNA-directed DNA polymerase
MKTTPDFKITIQKAFKAMESKSDFLALLNIAKSEIYGDKTIPFSETQLNYYITKDSAILKSKVDFQFNLSDEKVVVNKNVVVEKKNPRSNSCYTAFTIKKKSGKDRTIHAPIKGLKEFQKALNFILQCIHVPHNAATGFVLGKSIVDNAKVHVGQLYVYNIDLKDFFPSVDKSRVWGRLLVPPFNLGTTPQRKKIANMIASLSSTPMEVERFVDQEWIKVNTAVLPQGAPTSPTLTNAICEKMDIRLQGVAKRFGLNYTRYADDITFSSKHNTYEVKPNVFEKIYTPNSAFDTEVRKIITEQNFHVKEAKVRLQKEGFRQEVTGLVVNEKVNVTRSYIKQLRQWLYYWETYGYDKAYTYFLQKYSTEKSVIPKGKPNMMMVLEGKLLYLKMVKGEKDSTYLKLKERFDKLLNKDSDISKILDIWENEGIDKAMDVFYSQTTIKSTNEVASNEKLDKIFNSQIFL